MGKKPIAILGVSVSISTQTCNIKQIKFLDSNCGRGFARIEDTCLNISHTLATQDEIAEKCSEIGATPLVTKSDAHYFQIKVSLHL